MNIETSYAPEGKIVNEVIVINSDYIDLNPLSFVASEYPNYCFFIKRGGGNILLFNYEFYLDKQGNKYLVLWGNESDYSNEIENILNKKTKDDPTWSWARNVDAFTEGADKESYKHWLKICA